MAGRLVETVFDGPLAERLSGPATEGVRFYWLGQAGFVLEMGGRRLVVDPYLSDSLAEKYRGTARPHIRMMPPPILPQSLGGVDLVLSTHAHTDHMDPGTLPSLLKANPQARLVAPRAVLAQALARSGVAEERLVLIDAGQTIEPLPGLSITATRAAHETLETDSEGHHRFLGYVFEAAGLRIWHSGDCIPFDGLVDEVAPHAPDIALLPVNGRRPELSDNGVPGNFTIAEAISITDAIDARYLVAHHYGLFDFNTESPANIDAAAALSRATDVFRAKVGICYEWQGA
ncbi:L-ascorbate metabolism protein UlaG (beta-lactamase superfamily) [Neorhizobium alkalisoli]|uniref:L-ascorbate metabolism protein UlaG (Beta-lactamase superfamily) n=2 Tax=Neorhizobium alkalisoli TaxID=528178 RepID=A0A561R8U8_9HYPH|nr:L-ascorbate metabolism protein UlaG (beta-lactamase superfamily) [Neorhizobium alkalisoli]